MTQTLLQEPITQLGPITITYGHEQEGDQHVSLPYRIGTNIVLPVPFRELRMITLLDGTQFVVTHDENDGTFYGGVDEGQPFLVQIDDDLWFTLECEGEGDFLEALKPAILHTLEEHLGTAVTRRQGDVYTIPLPLNWSAIGKTESGEHRVGETRHTVNGTWAEVADLATGLSGDDGPIEISGLIAAGTLTAPDHAAIELGEEPHLVVPSDAIVGDKPERVLTDVEPDGTVVEGWIGD
jgi:hypothetical protein